jgi:hypothetical protein
MVSFDAYTHRVPDVPDEVIILRDRSRDLEIWVIFFSNPNTPTGAVCSEPSLHFQAPMPK